MNNEASEASDPETYAIIGAAMRVHSELGSGFLEAVYQEALKIEFECSKVPAAAQVRLQVMYRDRWLETFYVADFVCYGSVIVELKAQSELTAREEAQLLNYLKATGYQRGLLINFGRMSLQYKRMIRTIQSH